MDKYDVVIIGAGPSGIFSAIELSKLNKLKILIVDKGMDLQTRISLIEKEHRGITLSSGWGGAGAFSDGKLNLSLETGGRLTEILEKEKLEELLEYVDGIYLKFGADERIYGDEEEVLNKINSLCSKTRLNFIPTRIRHLGTENCREILKRMYEYLKDRVQIKFQTEVVKILAENKKVTGVVLDDGKEIKTDFLIASPGRLGAEWLTKEAKRLGIETVNNPVDVGVRVEVSSEILKYFTDSLYELKLVFYSRNFNDKVRTFCMCPYGYVVKEYTNGIITVNGHSYANRKSQNTNFAILVSTSFTEPFKEPITYGQYLAKLTNLLAEGIILQRLGDLKSGRRSTWKRIKEGKLAPTLEEVTPGDLSFALPYRYLSNILEMLEEMDRITPGINSPHTLLYGVEVKFYSSRLKVNNFLETEIKNFFACGDGAGITRGLLQASLSGVIAAREILKRYGV